MMGIALVCVTGCGGAVDSAVTAVVTSAPGRSVMDDVPISEPSDTGEDMSGSEDEPPMREPSDTGEDMSGSEDEPPIPSPRAQPTIADVVNNASAGDDAPDGKVWDVFISHATEDKKAVAGPLAHALQDRGLKVWYDDFELRIGASLRRSIDNGIARSRFGLVILSGPFFAKNWPQYELDGLVTRANSDQQILLPIWHGISRRMSSHPAPL